MKKAQGAMEFLMTYGWAILVVLIALGALYFLGVFDPKTAGKCDIQAPFTCTDISLYNDVAGALGVLKDNITLSIGASSVQNTDITSISVNGVTCPGGVQGEKTNLGRGMKIITCSYTNTQFDKGNKYSGVISLTYTTTISTLLHKVDGTFSGTVE